MGTAVASPVRGDPMEMCVFLEVLLENEKRNDENAVECE